MFKSDLREDLQNYLANTLDSGFAVEAICPDLPLHMRRYSFCRGSLLGKGLVFALVKVDEQTPAEYALMSQLLNRELSSPIVFVFRAIASAKRNALIRNGVAFVVPKWQFFLPPNLQLNERAPRESKVRKSMRPMSQLVVIRQLVNGDVEGKNSGEIAKMFGFSKMTVSNVFSELKVLGLADFAGRPGVVHFKTQGKKLWEAAFSYLRSPVRRIVPNALVPRNLPLAGLSALAEYSLIAPDATPVYACSADECRLPEVLKCMDYDGDAKSLLQIWRYDPRLCSNEQVDRLSLYLSFRDDCDPRVESEIERMLEENVWQ